MAKTVVAFDLYGTLLSTASIAQELSKVYGDDKAKAMATQARTYQLEYTWRINSMKTYHTFSDVTRWSFRQAAAEQGIKMTQEVEDRVMNAYNGLDTFPDAEKGLDLLADSPSVDPFIFSNGTASMLTSSMSTSPTLSKASSLLPAEKIISVEPLKVFKPDPAVYNYLAKVAGKENDTGSVWLVSSNPFDACGAVIAGLKSVWVDRTGLGWVDGIGCGTGNNPTIVAQGVDEAVREIVKHGGGQ